LPTSATAPSIYIIDFSACFERNFFVRVLGTYNVFESSGTEAVEKRGENATMTKHGFAHIIFVIRVVIVVGVVILIVFAPVLGLA